MKKRMILAGLAWFLLSLAVGPGLSQKANPRIDAFLKTAEKATSFGKLADWFQKQKFTEAEKKELAELMKTSPLGKKIQALYDSEGKAISQKGLSQMNAQVQQGKNRVMQDRRQRLVNHRSKAMALFNASKGPSAKVTFMSIDFSPMKIQARKPGMKGTPARINEFSPEPPLIVGRRFNIIGQNFGSTRGRVVLVMAPRSHRGRADMMDCTVARWGNELIQVTIPELAEAWLAGSEKTGVIWVKLAGGEVGPLEEVRIAPDISRIVPQISRLSTETIEPGAVLTISGENFCTSPEGTVNFVLLDAGRSFAGRVDVWSDTAIRVSMPEDIDRVQPQRCRVDVTNHLGNTGNRVIDFEPIWEVETLSKTHSFDHSITGSNFFYWWWGETGTYTDHEIRLINGWKVIRSYINCGGSANHGCEHREHPSEGATLCTSTVFIWCDGFARVWCANCVEITGPKGFSYR